MARIFMDTDAMDQTSATLAQIQAELESVPRSAIADAAVLMPPDVAAQVAAHLGQATVRIHDAASGYARNASDLRARRAQALGADAGGFAAGLLGLGTGLFGGGGHRGGGRGGMPLGPLGALLGGVPGAWGAVSGFSRSAFGRFNDVLGNAAFKTAKEVRSDVSAIGDALGYTTNAGRSAFGSGIMKVTGSKAFKVAGKLMLAVDLYTDAKVGRQDTRGETRDGATFTVAGWGAIDTVTTVWKPLGIIDAATGGSVSAGWKGLVGVGGGAISGAEHGVQSSARAAGRNLQDGNYLGMAKDLTIDMPGNVAGGALHEMGHSAELFGDGVRNGDFGIGPKLITGLEDHYIDTHFEQIVHVTNAVSDATHTIGNVSHGITSGLGHAVSGVFH